MADSTSPTRTEQPSEAAPDPFAAREGRAAGLAARVGMTEGQLYASVIGLLLAWTVSANALPSVVLDAEQPPAVLAGATPELAAAPAPLPPPVVVPEPVAPPFAPPEELSTGFFGDAPEPAPAPADEPGSGGAGPAFPAFPAPSTPSGQQPDDAGPLRVIDGGYTSSSAGTPLATAGVPAGSVAVARRAGSDDKVAYLRLAGRGPSLLLTVDRAGANVAEPLAALQLCVVTTQDWVVGPGDTALEDAPPTDCGKAVPGVRSADGSTWSFDVSKLDTSTVGGVAIKPTEQALPPEFQVVFSLQDATSDDAGTAPERHRNLFDTQEAR